jgi:two-component system CheB/CheR fusion protein
LTTLNEELRHTNIELGEVNNDLINLLRSVNLPVVMVSRDLRIRRFTPATQKTLKLIPSDIGRLITDLEPDIRIPNFDDQVPTGHRFSGHQRDRSPGHDRALAFVDYPTLRNGGQ